MKRKSIQSMLLLVSWDHAPAPETGSMSQMHRMTIFL